MRIQFARNGWNFAGQYQFEKFEKEITVVPNSMGIANFSTTISPPLKVGERVTAISIETAFGSSRISGAYEVTAPTKADVAIQSITAVPDPVAKGQSAVFEVRVNNNGPATANGVFLNAYQIAVLGIYPGSVDVSQGTFDVGAGSFLSAPWVHWELGSCRRARRRR